MFSPFPLTIITPEREFFNGNVEEVTFTSVDGEMGVLKGHNPSVAALIPGSIKLFTDGKWKEAANSEGFIEITPERVYILVQTAEWPEEIEENRVLSNIEKAEEKIRQKKSLLEYRMGKASIARAFARLKVKSRSRSSE